MEKILVTGGAGFIGSHLCKKLIDEGNYVFCLDNLFTGSLQNLKPVINNKNFKFIEGNIEDFIDIKADKIYNLACPASPVHYQKNPVKTIKTSVFGIVNILELARKYNSRVLQASTSEVYGNPIEHPQKESYWGNVNPIGLRSCYDEGKRCAETIITDYNRQYGTDTRIVRIFNTYGPNMHPDDGRVVSNFIIQALRNENITIYGDGSQTRSFCYISDLIEGVTKVMNTENITTPVNLGNPEEITVLELAEKIIRLTGSKSTFTFKSLPSDDPVKRKPDISHARRILNWYPKVDTDKGFKFTVEYYKKLLNL